MDSCICPNQSIFLGLHLEKLAKSENLHIQLVALTKNKCRSGTQTTCGHISRLFFLQLAVKNSLKFTKCQLSTRGPIVNGEVVPSPQFV